MLKLENRIDALERATGPRKDFTVYVIFGRPGPSGPIEDEPIAYVGRNDERWNRCPGETLEQLRARASREAKRGSFGIAVLRECYADDAEVTCN